jgi:pyruvate dehydrogenase E1 component alpha subunit
MARHLKGNFAGVFQLPVIFVCQNNHWAISIPRSRQTHAKTLAQKALAYGMPGIQVDGNDVLAVYAAVREAVDRARSGGGPTMIECVTYRVAMHTTADDPKRYRSDEEVQLWLRRDPITRFQKYLQEKGLLNDAAVASVEQEVQAEVQRAVDRAEAYMATAPNPLEMFDHIYAEPPGNLREQRAELERELAADAEEVQDG